MSPFTLLIGLAAVAVIVLIAALMFFGGNRTPVATPVTPRTPEARSTPSDHAHGH